MGPDQEGNIERGLVAADASAWNALYEMYFERVWSAAARLIGPHRDEVGDVVQETFMAAAKSAKNYDSARSSLWSWLMTILRSEVANHFRRRYREQRLAPGGDMVDQVWLQVSQWLEGRGEMPDDRLNTAEVADAVRLTLSRLPEDYQDLLLLRYRDDLPVSDLATRCDSSETAVRSKLSRARQAFRDAFGKQPIGEDMANVESETDVTNKKEVPQ